MGNTPSSSLHLKCEDGSNRISTPTPGEKEIASFSKEQFGSGYQKSHLLVSYWNLPQRYNYEFAWQCCL